MNFVSFSTKLRTELKSYDFCSSIISTTRKSRYGMFHAKCFASDKALYRNQNQTDSNNHFPSEVEP